MRHFGPGTLAYIDSIGGGLVPCKVVSVGYDGTHTVVVTVTTADRAGYPKGEVITHRGSAGMRYVVPRACVSRWRIQTDYSWLDEGPANA